MTRTDKSRLQNARRVAAFRARQRAKTPLQRHTDLDADTLYTAAEQEILASIRQAQASLEDACQRLNLLLKDRFNAEATDALDPGRQKAIHDILETLDGIWRVELPTV